MREKIIHIYENIKQSFTKQTREQKIGLGIFLTIVVLLVFGFVLNHRKLKNRSISNFINEIAIYDTLPKIVFENKVFNFGTIAEGDSVKANFVFINKGQKPLFISEVLTTCGCTTVDFTRDSIMTGSNGEVNILFESRNKSGIIDKDISVISNASNNDVFLRIKGYVK